MPAEHMKMHTAFSLSPLWSTQKWASWRYDPIWSRWYCRYGELKQSINNWNCWFWYENSTTDVDIEISSYGM